MLCRSKTFLTFILFVLTSSPALAQLPAGATSLGDLAQSRKARGSDPHSFVTVGDRVFFSANHYASGRELWVSDGTGAGTQILRDIRPGLRNSHPSNMSELDGHLVFKALISPLDSRLWISDGTPEGTVQITDGVRHPALNLSELIVFEGYVYFGGRNDESGSQVWRYSIADDELVQVTNFVPGPIDIIPDQFRIMAGRLLFNTDSGMHVIEPGIPGAAPFNPPGVKELRFFHWHSFVEFKDYFYFTAISPATGSELWRTDGTAEGTSLVVDLFTGYRSSDPSSLVTYRNQLYFIAGFGDSDRGLFVSDGTASGTHRVRNQLLTNSDLPHQLSSLSRSSTIAPLHAVSPDPQSVESNSSNVALSRSWPQENRMAGGTRRDGSVHGTQILHDQLLRYIESAKLTLSAQPSPSSSLFPLLSSGPKRVDQSTANTSQTDPWPMEILYLSVLDDVLYFSGVNSDYDLLLWRSDGTAAGSEAIRRPAGLGNYFGFSGPFTLFNQTYAFGYSGATGFELWRIVDGKSLEPVGDFDPGNGDGFTGAFEFNGTVLFAGSTPETGHELREFVGSVESRRLIANIMPDDSADSTNSNKVEANGSVYFFGPGDKPNDAALWKTDGTPDTTVRLIEFEAPTDAYDNVRPVWLGTFTELNSRVLFSAFSNYDVDVNGEWAVDGEDIQKISDQPMGYKVKLGDVAISLISGNPWRTNADKDSVIQLAAINDGSYYVPTARWYASDNYVWFFSGNPEQSSGVWKTDGTSTGTVLAADVTKSDYFIDYFGLGSLDDNFLYLTRDNGVRLWRTGDSGTTQLALLLSYISYRDFLDAGYAQIGNKIILTRYRSDGTGTDLWVTDGSVAGTQRLGQIATDERHVGDIMVATDEGVYFTGSDEVHRQTLWRSDGTKEGTGKAFDSQDVDMQSVEEFIEHNGKLYFVGKTTASGEEIWKMEGNRAVQVTELMPGSLSAGPSNLVSAGGRLYFLAYVPGQGREIMILDE